MSRRRGQVQRAGFCSRRLPRDVVARRRGSADLHEVGARCQSIQTQRTRAGDVLRHRGLQQTFDSAHDLNQIESHKTAGLQRVQANHICRRADMREIELVVVEIAGGAQTQVRRRADVVEVAKG